MLTSYKNTLREIFRIMFDTNLGTTAQPTYKINLYSLIQYDSTYMKCPE